MKRIGKCITALLLGALSWVSLSSAAAEVEFPKRVVRLIVPFSPGGPTDVVARILADKLQGTWGKSVIVDNKPGGGTIVGTDYVAKSPPDGYTIGVVVSAHM